MISLSKTMMCPSKMNSEKCGFGYPSKNGKPNFNKLVVANRGDEIDAVLNDAHATVFEFLHPEATTKMYFDIDMKCEGEQDCLSSKVAVLEDAVENIMEMFPKLKRDQLAVSSYSGQDLSVNKNNNKYGKWVISYHIVVDGCTLPRKQNHAVAKLLHERNETFDTSVYSGNQMFRFAGSHKFATREKGCRSPKFVLYCQEKGWYELEAGHHMTKDERMNLKYKNLITYTSSEMMCLDGQIPKSCIPISCIPLKPPPSASPPPAKKQKNINNALLELLKKLPDTDRDEFKDWFWISTLCKALDEQGTWDAWSRESDRFDAHQNEIHWSNIQNYEKYSKNAMAILKKRVNGSSGDPVIWELHQCFEKDEDISHCEFFVKQFGKFFKVVDSKLMYLFSQETQLWIPSSNNCVHTFMLRGEYQKFTNEYIAEMEAHPEKYFGKIPEGCEDKDSFYAKKKSKRRNQIKGTQMCKTINSWAKLILGSEAILDAHFPKKLNHRRDLLPVRNGMVNLATGELEERKPEHFCSQCLDIVFDPESKPEDNPLFMKFIHDIFDAKELDTAAVLRWFQLWMGYCTTGYSNMESCCVFFGGGANGKSLLQEIMLNVMKCWTGSMVATWNYKIIDEASNAGNANAATPELAKMEGVRAGFINELADSMFLGEAFKRTIDYSEGLSVRQLHQHSKEIAHTTVFNLLTNSFPHFKTDYCFYRRIKVLPMLMKFCPKPEEDKSPNARLVDTSLKLKMFENEKMRQGILAWLIQGAVMFMKNPKAVNEQPQCCEDYKVMYVQQNNYMRLFEKSEDKKDRITIKDAIEHIRTEFEKTPTQAELAEKLRELTGEKKTRNVMGSSGKRTAGFWYVKMVNILDDEDDE